MHTFLNLFLDNTSNINRRLSDVVSRDKLYELYNLTLFEIAQRYYNINETNIKAILPMDETLINFLTTTKFQMLKVCYFLTVERTLNEMINQIKYFQQNPGQTITFVNRILSALQPLNGDLVEKYTKGVTLSLIPEFCPVYVNLTETMYDPFMFDAVIFYYGKPSNSEQYKQELIKTLGKLGVTQLVKEYILAQYRGDKFGLYFKSKEILEMILNAGGSIMIKEEDLQKTLFQVMADALQTSANITQHIVMQFAAYPEHPSRVASSMAIEKLKGLIDGGTIVGKTLAELFSIVQQTGERNQKLSITPIIFLKRNLSKDYILQKTMMQLSLEISNDTEEFMIVYYAMNKETIHRMKNFTLQQLFDKYFKDQSITRLLHVSIFQFADDADFAKISQGYYSTRMKNLETFISQGYHYVFNNVSIKAVRETYGIPENELLEAITKLLTKYMDIRKEELAKTFTRTTINIFETFSILHVLTKPELHDGMSFKELDMALSRGGKFLHSLLLSIRLKIFREAMFYIHRYVKFKSI